MKLHDAIIEMYGRMHGDWLGQDIVFSRRLPEHDQEGIFLYITKGRIPRQKLPHGLPVNNVSPLPPASRRAKTSDECRMCFSGKGIVYRDNVVITPDVIPFLGYHSLIRPLRQGLDFNAGLDGFNDFGNYKTGFVTKDMLDCRKLPIASDIDSCVELASETGFSLLLGIKGTGGGVPEHVHFQAYVITGEGALELPLIRKKNFRELVKTKTMEVLVMDEPSFGFALLGDKSQYAAIVTKLYNQFKSYRNHDNVGLPFNLLLTRDSDLSDNVVAVYFPRTMEAPTSEVFVYEDNTWRFGFGEIMGSLPARSMEQFENLTPQDVYWALKETTIGRGELKQEMKDSLIRIVQG
jgi:hypothetical protein